MTIDEILAAGPVMPVVVIDDAAHAVPLAKALVAGASPLGSSVREKSRFAWYFASFGEAMAVLCVAEPSRGANASARRRF